METEININAGHDLEAVQAVRDGDAERYRELVERHERRVFAVAWSRLGDAALAEEAAQEAFVRAYQRLWLLRDGAKFSAWITAITRRVAINCGLRHRRELNRRERWALEQNEPPAEETPELYPPETLRQALAELPAAHRECLVLFYLEGKSGAEAAATLGISESALRVRLHRARMVLRERLEGRLAESLEQLRPPRPLATGVMAAILSSPVKAAGGMGAGAKFLAWLLPFKFLTWFVWIFWAIGFLPGLLLQQATIRMDQKNFRDAQGFRARQYNEFVKKKRYWVWLVLGIGMPLLVYASMYAFSSGGFGTFGLRQFYLLMGVALLAPLFYSARKMVILRNRYLVCTLVASIVLMAGLFTIGLNLLPVSAFNVCMALYLLAFAVGYGSRPLRMDYNLFLRASQNILPPSPVENSRNETTRPLHKTDLIRFARFLGSGWLVFDFQWEEQGLKLRLPPIKVTFWNSVRSSFGNRASRLLLRWNGSVSARLGESDEQAMPPVAGHDLAAGEDLEKQVAASVATAWHLFRAGRADDARRSLGEQAETDVFLVPTARSKSTRWTQGFMFAMVALMVVLNTVAYTMIWRSKLKPVNVTEAEIRATLAALDKPTYSLTSTGDWMSALNLHTVLPPTNLFSPGALQAMRTDAFRMANVNTGNSETKLIVVSRQWLVEKALVNGWISYDEIGVTPAQAAAYLRASPPREYSQFMRRRDPVSGKDYEDTRMEDLPLAQLRWLRDVHCLDLLDRQMIVAQLRSAQVLSGDSAASQSPPADWRLVRGLFVPPRPAVLQDTYRALAALEILGALDAIDREACITGILHLHHGRGDFPCPEGSASFGIYGTAQDTFCAFESLRILGALDRVKDLDKWQFRPATVSKSTLALRTVTWDEIEAWLCAQRLARDLAEHQQNPAAPWRSLLDP